MMTAFVFTMHYFDKLKKKNNQLTLKITSKALIVFFLLTTERVFVTVFVCLCTYVFMNEQEAMSQMSIY